MKLCPMKGKTKAPSSKSKSKTKNVAAVELGSETEDASSEEYKSPVKETT